MGRLRTLTMLLTLGAWGAATEGAPPDNAAPSAMSPGAKAPAPVAPVKYLEAGARLYNSGDYGQAAKYINAAQTYRDQLSPSEQTVLDAYLKEMANSPSDGGDAGTPEASVPPASVPAADSSASTVDPSVATADQSGDANMEPKSKAKWLLLTAREQLSQGNYDAAAAKVAQARALNVRFGLFDDTPAKVSEAIEKARPKMVAANTAGQAKDRSAAKTKLKEARSAIDGKQYEQAEAIALDVKSWNLSYGIFEDTPDKVAAAARALRRRDTLRNGSPKEAPSLGVYDLLVQEARQLTAKGEFDLAEQKAKQAQRMNVVPPVTADRAEAALHDLTMARARSTGKGDQQVAVASVDAPEANSSADKAEQEANALLAKGDTKAASAKFTEAEALRDKEAPAPAAEGVVADEPIVLAAPDAAGDPAAPKADVADDAKAPADAVTEDKPVAAGNRGEQLLVEANALYKGGNYAAAKQLAEQAKAGGFGVETKAEEMIAQIGLQEQGGALNLYESALDAVRKGDVARARAMLTNVAASGDGVDEGLREKVTSLLAKLPADGAGKATATDKLADANDAEMLAAQRMNAEVGTKIAEGRRLQETDPDKAIALYSETLKGVSAAGLPEAAARTMSRRLEVALELSKKDKISFDLKMKDKAFRAEIEKKRLRIFEADKAKKDRMKEIMEKALTAMSNGKYVEAETYAKRAMEIDPDDVTAPAIVWKAKIERRVKRDIENRDDKEDGVVTAFQEVDRAAVADPEVQLNGIKYLKSFKDLTIERRRMNAKLEIKKDPKTLEIAAKLNDPIQLNMEKQPLGEAINFLRNYTGLNIVLDTKALSEENVSMASPVDLVGKFKLRTALKLMLRPMGLSWRVDDDVLVITSPSSSQAETITQPYYVADLILAKQKSPMNLDGTPTSTPSLVPTADPVAATAQAVQLSKENSSGVNANPTDRPNVDMSPLITLITSSIAPGTWRINDPSGNDQTAAYGMGAGGAGGGGGVGDDAPPGSITPFFLSISLIIRHTAEVHDQVADLLKQLRRLQDLQVSIEVRFITVSDTFFEQIGVDFDFSIQSDAIGKHSTFAFPSLLNGGGVGGGQGGGGQGGGGQGGGGQGGGGQGGGGQGGGGQGGGGQGGGGQGGGGGVGGGGGGQGGGGQGGGGQGGGGQGGGGQGGGGQGGGGQGGGGGGGGGGIAPYIINPIRDNTIGSRGPLTVGLQSGGIAGFTPNLQIPFTQGSSALATPSQAVPGAGATFGIAFLSDLEVYLFLTAAQGDIRTNILQAPKVTTFNGAVATINSSQVINYVRELIPIVGPASVAFFPQVAQFNNGVTLTVTPVVSADRRYVRMTVNPVFTAIEGFDTIQVPAAVGSTGFGGGSTINGTIQLPRFTFTTVQTTVTVPDGGTILLGGVKRMNEERREYGVPVLSKTPWLNRLFRNVGIDRVTSSFMLMITPRIIILEEEEEKLGIPSVAF